VVDWDEHIALPITCNGWRKWWLAIADNIAQKPLLASPEPSIHRRQPAARYRRPASAAVADRSRTAPHQDEGVC
jgi:hypothetical protein